MGKPVVHFEILAKNGQELIDFYQPLFDWNLRVASLPGWPDYGFLKTDEGTNGAVGSTDVIDHPATIVYVEVEDPHEYLDRAVKLGASVVMPVRDVPEAEVTVAWFKDPGGNVVGLVKDWEHA